MNLYIIYINVLLYELLAVGVTRAFKDIVADPETFSSLETNEEVRCFCVTPGQPEKEMKELKLDKDRYPINSLPEEPKNNRRRVDSKDSWLQFLRRSRPDTDTNRRRKNRRKQQRLGCPPGPPGPQGPPGPAGPKGAKVSIEDLKAEYTDVVKKAAEQAATDVLTQKCGVCSSVINNTGVALPTNDVTSLPRITSGFHMRLRRNVIISSGLYIELDSFHQPFAAGSFQRGNAFNIKNGRFTAPKSGIYQFSVNLHMTVKRKGRRSKLKRKDAIQTQICIDSLCNKYVSLRHVSGVESNSKIFTVSFSGFIELAQAQYVSVYVDNASRMNIVIQSSSDFTGIMMGT